MAKYRLSNMAKNWFDGPPAKPNPKVILESIFSKGSFPVLWNNLYLFWKRIGRNIWLQSLGFESTGRMQEGDGSSKPP